MSMLIALAPLPANSAETNEQLSFMQRLQEITSKIQVASNLDEIMLEVSKDACTLFHADRLTVYTMSEDKSSIISRVQTGYRSFQNLQLPITEHSILSFVSLHKKTVNLRDVYDQHELIKLDTQLHFLKEADKRTGYRTKQMMVAPILNAADNELLGMVQAINHKDDKPFSDMVVEGAGEICQVLAIALKQRQKQQLLAKSKYGYLVSAAILSAAELELAARAAREKGCDLEHVLIDEFQIKSAQIGAALADYFHVRYEPYRPDRIKPIEVLKHLKRDFAESNQWLPIDEAKDGMVIKRVSAKKIPVTSMTCSLILRRTRKKRQSK